jgi:hypothetical protein
MELSDGSTKAMDENKQRERAGLRWKFVAMRMRSIKCANFGVCDARLGYGVASKGGVLFE